MWPFRKKQPEAEAKALAPAEDYGWTRIFDWRPGAWQSHAAYTTSDSVVTHSALFACTSLISGDIAKLRPLVQRRSGGIWTDVRGNAFALLSNPNSYQNHIRFKQQWIESKLLHGNTYVLKEREGRQITALHVLDPTKVEPLISDAGEVFYRLKRHRLARQPEDINVPAREIIHDRWNCIYHPLVGLPPIYASAAPSRMGLTIQGNAKEFFDNASNASGVLTAPGNISDETAKRLKEYWEGGFTGSNSGRVAILGDGLEYQQMRMSNVDAQMLEHLKWTAETICSTFRVPGYMIGVGQMPTHNNIEALVTQYYSQCLQVLIEDMEAALDNGINVPNGQRVQLDLDGLFRMDTQTHVESLARAVGAGIMAPDEARAKLNLGPVPGGQHPYLQQQNYSLEALASRGSAPD
ncbi:phage portal protein [Pseudohaliea sp.]|uniref:phage portal protein n=1 Tax=Pseudohaliea sp. TaxID=2740289 RepID=UPI0032F04640